MSIFPTKAHRLVPICFALLLTFSCSKDSDLLADYVSPGGLDGQLRRFVVDDTFRTAVNASIRLDVLSNDNYPEEKKVRIKRTSNPRSGNVTINEDNTITYEPTGPEETTDSFEYTTEVVNEDTSVSEETGTVTVIISNNENNSEDKDSGSLKAFPSAYGGGSTASGGRGGTLVIVNTLNFNAPLVYDQAHDVYEGGLKEALSKKIGPRYIVFSVSGVIDGGGSELFVTENGNFTLFGQSAPKGGITLNRGWIKMVKSNNVIMRYLTIRPAVTSGFPAIDDNVSTALKIGNKDVIIDHCSASWGGDKGIIAGDWRDGYPIQNITVQNCLIADSNTLGFSVDGIDGGAGDWDVAGNISWHYNFLSGGNRTPNMGGFNGLGVIQNNIVQSHGTKLSTIVYGDPKINHVGNYYYIHKTSVIPNRFQDLGSNSARIYSKQNYYQNLNGVLLNGTSSENNEKIWINTSNGGQLSSSYFTNTKNGSTIPNEPPLFSPQEALTKVLSNVGANKYLDNVGNVQVLQDSYDQRAIDNFKKGVLEFALNSTTWVLSDFISSTTTSTNNKRPADYDTDKDGLADAWELNILGDLSQGYNDDHDGDGYTNIEEYMNQVDH